MATTGWVGERAAPKTTTGAPGTALEEKEEEEEEELVATGTCRYRDM